MVRTTLAAIASLALTSTLVEGTFLPTTGTATFANNETVAITLTGNTVNANGAVVTNSYDCANAAGTVTTVKGKSDLFGRAVTKGGDCTYVVADGDGTDFFGARIASLEKWIDTEKGEVVLFDQTEIGNEGGPDADGQAAVSVDAGVVYLEKLLVELPALENGIYQMRVTESCNGANVGAADYAYNTATPSSTNGHVLPVGDGDVGGTAEVTGTGLGSLSGANPLAGKSIEVGTLSAANAYSLIYCGTVIGQNSISGYVAAKAVAGGVDVTGSLYGLPPNIIGSYHIHEVADDADNQGRKYPVCSDEATIGEHVLDQNQNDNFVKGDSTSAATYSSNAQGEATVVNQIRTQAEEAASVYTNADLQYNAVIIHSEAAGKELQYELKLGCGSLNIPPPFGGVGAPTVPVTNTGDASVRGYPVLSGLVSVAVAFVAARFA